MSSPEREKEIKILNDIAKFTKQNAIDKSYNKFERAYEIMIELTKSPLPLEPTELISISHKELNYLKKSIELMYDYLDSVGFDFLNIKEEILIPIYEELEKRANTKKDREKR